MMHILLQILPEHIAHLKNGGMLAFEARPLDGKLKPVSLAFNLKHIYEVRIMPHQHFVSDDPIFDVPQNASPERVLAIIVKSLMHLASVAGPTEISFSIAEFKANN